ncbi:hypothetical protein [Arenimonas donghaensis]|uniref:Uncharacterized protein n=1 Tax=Arenimonas donghaensis DSM 18148 = HO3-R19 TaxID=1121014 RepID=A0A087MFN6_9GAMM|nr:hypothetical protein [Arenimonas donghaensis]KFL35689.1 hypothetical protein N788_08100 [Arenimonas donghaensis DSM 18148 = HO3-R19]
MRRSDLVPALLLLALLAPVALAQGQGGTDFKVELDPETCVFTGGSDGAGNVEVAANTGNKKIQLRLGGGRDYGISDIIFSGEGQDQMTYTAGGQASVANIFNRNSGPADVKYSVIVENRSTGETRDCDPRIINR